MTTPTPELDPDGNPRIYPCADCGIMRSLPEGGTTFTVCDDCWDKLYKKHPKPSPEKPRCGGSGKIAVPRNPPPAEFEREWIPDTCEIDCPGCPDCDSKTVPDEAKPSLAREVLEAEKRVKGYPVEMNGDQFNDAFAVALFMENAAPQLARRVEELEAMLNLKPSIEIGGTMDILSEDEIAFERCGLLDEYRALKSQRDDARAEVGRLKEIMDRVARWEMPRSNRFFEDGEEMSYGFAFGSHGEREFVRNLCKEALKGKTDGTKAS